MSDVYRSSIIKSDAGATYKEAAESLEKYGWHIVGSRQSFQGVWLYDIEKCIRGYW